MNLRDFSKDDILNALGLELRKTPGDFVLPALGVFGAGLLVGAGLALLFAPKSGNELRSDIGRRMEDARTRMSKRNHEPAEQDMYANQ